MPPTNALGNWYVNLIYIGRTQMVIATSERSLLTVLLPAADLCNSLVVNLVDTTYLLLQEIGIDSACAEREAEAMQPAPIARTETFAREGTEVTEKHSRIVAKQSAEPDSPRRNP